MTVILKWDFYFKEFDCFNDYKQFPLCFLVEGRTHDAGMLADSHLLDELELHAHSPTGETMCLYGDPAYPVRSHLQAPFRPGNKLNRESKIISQPCTKMCN